MSLLNHIATLSIGPFSGPQGPQAPPGRMSLEERIALRREMAVAVVHGVMAAWGLPEASYRFRVEPADPRCHSFVAMVDLPVEVMTTERISHRDLLRLGELMDVAASKRFNLKMPGVYWRIDEALNIDLSDHTGTRQKTPDDPRAATAPVPQTPEAARLSAIERSLARGDTAHVDGRIYATDLAPLEPPVPKERSPGHH